MTTEHTKECLHNGNASRCPICKPINDKFNLISACKEALLYIDYSHPKGLATKNKIEQAIKQAG